MHVPWGAFSRDGSIHKPCNGSIVELPLHHQLFSATFLFWMQKRLGFSVP